MLINLIVAVDSKWGIAKEGVIPWKITEDVNFFQDVTKRSNLCNKKNALIMGKNTYLSIPNKLKDRIIIVISKTINESNDSNVYFSKSLSEAIDLYIKLDINNIFICGGSAIYKEALETLNIDEIYLTKIDYDYNCDNIFPIINLNLQEYREQHNMSFTINNVNVDFLKYSNIKNLNIEEQKYLDLLYDILKNGDFKQTRNSKTLSTFGKTLEFDLSKGFPLLTTKKVFFRGIFEELLFFLKGDTNTKNLSDVGVKIWEPNTTREFLDSVGLFNYPKNTMGPMYGFQLKHFNANYKGYDYNYTNQGINQIEYCLNLLKNDPYSRRIMMTTYNPNQVNQGVLYPCHGISIIFNVDNKHKLSCMMTQRSVDIVCGLPFNIASYALLIHLFCEVINNDINYLGKKFYPGNLTMVLGDTHIYEDHHTSIIRQILRDPYKFPELVINRKVTDLTDFKFEDLELINYISYPAISFKMVA